MRTAKSSSKFGAGVDRAGRLLAGAAPALAQIDAGYRERPLCAVAGGRLACCGSTPEPARFRPATIRARGWACYAVPDERAAMDTEIGRLQADIGRLQADNEKLKAQLAEREPTVTGKIEEPLPKSDSLKKSGAEGRRGRAQDRNPAAERPRHGSHDVVPGTGVASPDRDGQPGAEGRQRQDLMLAVRPSASRPGERRDP